MVSKSVIERVEKWFWPGNDPKWSIWALSFFFGFWGSKIGLKSALARQVFELRKKNFRIVFVPP